MRNLGLAVERWSPFRRRSFLGFGDGLVVMLALLAAGDLRAQVATYALGTASVVVGPSAGSSSVVLAATPSTATWTNVSGAAWLTLASTNGVGSADVVFRYLANPGVTRSASLSLAGQTLTVTQAGSNYVQVTNDLTALLSDGLNEPQGLAVDGVGNVYIADTYDNAIKLCILTNGSPEVATLVSSGLNEPNAVALDASGNVYIADSGNNAIKRWSPTTGKVTNFISSGLLYPSGVAVDQAGNVYIADTYHSAIKEWVATSGKLVTLVSAGLNYPAAVAVDRAGNVYIADTLNNAIKEWTAANSSVVTLFTNGLKEPNGVAVDGEGNVYFADTGNSAIREWTASNSQVTTMVSSGLFYPYGVAVDGTGNVYVADTFDSAIQEQPYAFIVPTGLSESTNAGEDALPPVLPSSENLLGLFAPFSSDTNWLAITDTSDGVVSLAFSDTSSNRTAYITLLGQNILVTQTAPTSSLATNAVLDTAAAGTNSVTLMVSPSTTSWTAMANVSWLHIATNDLSGTGDATVVFTVDTNPGLEPRTGTLTIAGQTLTITQGGASFILGSASILEGNAAGSDSVVLVATHPTNTWTAEANAPWLHLAANSENGAGSANVLFSFDSNTNGTRMGTLSIGSLILTVTQAGSSYIPAANSLATLVSAGLDEPSGVAVDSAGNIYVADTDNNAIKEWLPGSTNAVTLFTNGLSQPRGVAVDAEGNLYIADTGNNEIKKWSPGHSNSTTLANTGSSFPYGVAVDLTGNVYIADTGTSEILEWEAASSNLTSLVTNGLNQPRGVAVDAAGNVYIADTGHGAVKKWSLGETNLVTLMSTGLSSPYGVAVDGSGNVYIADTLDNEVKKWSAANSNLSTIIVSALGAPYGVAVDGMDNVYVANTASNSVVEFPYAFVDPSPISEINAAVNDALPAVLPTNESLLAPFVPASDTNWLTITGETNGIVTFSVAANLGFSRAAQIMLLGQSILVTQGGPVCSLGASALLVGPTAGSSSVVLAVTPNIGPWTAMNNASWLHLSANDASGVGSTNVVFEFDANTGATRTGTLTIGGQTLAVTQAGSSYVGSTNFLATLVSGGLNQAMSAAVDSQGNVYIADTENNAIKKWSPGETQATTLFTNGLNQPRGVAVDGSGNLYISDTGNFAVKKLSSGATNTTVLVGSGLGSPYGLAVDAKGNVYMADFGNSAILEWSSANSNVTTMVSKGLLFPAGVAVDAAGNVYIADTFHKAIKVWSPANSNLTTVVSSGLSSLCQGVAVDGSGNVYIADTGNNALKKWTAASGGVSTIAAGLSSPSAVAVDVTGNIYIQETNALADAPYAFVDTAPKIENDASGADSLSTVLPASQSLLTPFVPVSNESWLIPSIANGIVNFTFTSNTSGSDRNGSITVLGQAVPVTQEVGFSPTLGGAQWLGSGVFQFSFTSVPNVTFTVLSSTNLALPLENWSVVGVASNTTSAEVFQFTTPPDTNDTQVFFRVVSTNTPP